jgi:hypothetical protein
VTGRTDSRIRSTPSSALNASSNSDKTDLDNAFGGNLPGEYLPGPTEDPADGASMQATHQTPETPPRQGTHTHLLTVGDQPKRHPHRARGGGPETVPLVQPHTGWVGHESDVGVAWSGGTDVFQQSAEQCVAEPATLVQRQDSHVDDVEVPATVR